MFILDSFFEFDWDQAIILRYAERKGFGGYGELSGLEEPIQKSAT